MQRPARTLFTLLLLFSSCACMAGAPDVRSQAALVLDRADGQGLFARDADRPVPIASITKLMSTLVVLDAGQPLGEKLEVTTQDRIRGRDVVIVLLNSWGKYTQVADARRIRKWMENRSTATAAMALRAGG